MSSVAQESIRAAANRAGGRAVRRQGVFSLVVATVVLGSVIAIMREWKYASHSEDQHMAEIHAETHHGIVHLDGSFEETVSAHAHHHHQDASPSEIANMLISEATQVVHTLTAAEAEEETHAQEAHEREEREGVSGAVSGGGAPDELGSPTDQLLHKAPHAEQSSVPMPKIEMGPDGIPIVPKVQKGLVPTAMLPIASTAAIQALVQKADDKSTQKSLAEKRADWTLPPLTPAVMSEGSNSVPGSDRRAVAVMFSDFKPGGAEKAQEQVSMVLNWVRHMKRLKVNCLVAVCEESIGKKEVWPLLEEAWCIPFLAPRQETTENPKAGRWWYVHDMLSAGFDVLSSDADVAWLRDPMPYFGELLKAHPAADVLTSTDANEGIYAWPASEGLHVELVPIKGTPPTPLKNKWAASFPSIPNVEGLVRKPEHASRDSTGWIEELFGRLKKSPNDLGLEDPNNCGAQWNTGVMFWRATDAAKELLEASKERMALDRSWPANKRDDQRPINEALRVASRFCAWSDEDKSPKDQPGCKGDVALNTVGGGKGCIGILPVAQFSNGFTFAHARLHEQYGVVPFSFHATYAANKPLKLREEGLVLDQRVTARVNEPALLVYDVAIPSDLFPVPTTQEDVYRGEITPWQHSALMHYQIGLLRNALAIAHVLKRQLVLPRMACLCECFFFRGANCTIEGHRVRLPHVCPTDHWLQNGGRNLRVGHVPPGYLDSPSLSDAFLLSTATVGPCDGNNCDNADGNLGKRDWREPRPVLMATHNSQQMAAPPPVTSEILLRRNANDEEVDAVLGKYDYIRILRLKDVKHAWGGFANQADEDDFRSRIEKALGAWCCWGKEGRGTQFEFPEGERTDAEQFMLTYEWGGGAGRVAPLGEGIEGGVCAA